MKTIILDTVDSTNTWLKSHASELEDMTMVVAREQTAGRGQRGNSWESEPGANLTFSLLFRPHEFEASHQFGISEAVALAIADSLEELYGLKAEVKWPNDIYVGNRKICGILIEHSLCGRFIERTIAGAGININQKEFLSDAPNPVSVFQLTDHINDCDEAASVVARNIEKRIGELSTDTAAHHEEFMHRLWRGEGYHPFLDRKTGRRYLGRIDRVDADGMMHISEENGTSRTYAFKEVEFLL